MKETGVPEAPSETSGNSTRSGFDSEARGAESGAPATSEESAAASPGHPPRRWRPRHWRRWAAGVAAVAALGAILVWVLGDSSTHRLPGETISGQAVGSEATTSLDAQAAKATADGNPVVALRDYRKALASDPTDAVALTGEGWLLIQTEQKSLFQQGMALLSAAEQADPTYEPAHLYRGTALLSANDNADGIAELQYYLAHGPNPSLVPRVEAAIASAEQG